MHVHRGPEGADDKQQTPLDTRSSDPHEKKTRSGPRLYHCLSQNLVRTNFNFTHVPGRYRI